MAHGAPGPAQRRQDRGLPLSPAEPDRAVERIEDEAVFDEWRRHHAGARRSLARARLFAAELGLRADGLTRLPLIGVVGSKGKGTIALYASAALAAAGHRVGTVMSPGIRSNRDRIRIGGQALTEAEYRDLLEVVRQAKQRLPPVGADGGYLSPTGTFTLAGAYALIEAGCTALVLEAGIGGASDELSLFDPDVAAVGAIFGEHLDLLGPTVLDVAENKLGIVKDRTRVIVTVAQDGPVAQLVSSAAEARGARLETVPATSAESAESVAPAVSEAGLSPLIAPLLPPGFGTANALAGILAAQALLDVSGGTRPPEQDLIRVLRTVRYPGRLSVHEAADGSRLILDTAVSGIGLRTALAFAEKSFGGPPDRVLVSLPATKDFDGFLDELRGLNRPAYFVELAREHLAYPAKSRWPWPATWVGENALADGLLSGNVLAVGTVSFVTALMNRLRIDADQLFSG